MSYTDVIERLSRNLRPVSDEQGANAAVALLLKLEKRSLSILIVERVENPSDPWSGQMAFPGGKRESKDLNLKQTVMRETLEETNISLLDRCHFLGVLAAQRSRPRPDIRILPFVILLGYEPSIMLSEKELKDFVWISPRNILSSKRQVKFSFGEFPAYVVGGKVIWGMTYRVLEDFFQAGGFQLQ